MKTSRMLDKRIAFAIFTQLFFFHSVQAQISCCTDGFQPQTITLQYSGEDCSATHTVQEEGTHHCTGDPEFDPLVYIMVNNRKNVQDGNMWFEGWVGINQQFLLDSRTGGQAKFRANAFIHVYDTIGGVEIQNIEFHTSCSQPLVIGDQWGAFTLIGVTSRKNDLTCGTPLPVELIKFEANFINDNIPLEWSTASEENNSHFEVQRSTNAQDFTTIAKVYSKTENGYSTSILNYNFTDFDAKRTGEKVFFYRLLQVDFDGQSAYSNMEVVDINSTSMNTIEVFPNPITDFVHINLKQFVRAKANLYVMDFMGKVLFQAELDKMEASVEYNIDLSHLDRGTYLLMVEENGRTIQRKIVIERN